MKPIWMLNMDPRYAASLFDHKHVKSGRRIQERLHAPTLKIGGVYRPSIHGGIEGTNPVMAEVVIMPNISRGLLMVDLRFGPEAAEYMGRPVLGFDGTQPKSYFGDFDTTESGIASTRVYAYADGTAQMSVEKARGDKAVLTGITADEAVAFMSACFTAIDIHRSRSVA